MGVVVNRWLSGVVLRVVALAVIIAAPPVVFSADAEVAGLSQWADNWRASEKVRGADPLIESLQRDTGRAHVIVSFKKPAKTAFSQPLNTPIVRQRVRNAIEAARAVIVRQLNTNNIQLYRRFSYIHSFAATVNAQGINELMALPAIKTIAPDRILEAHLAQGIPLASAEVVRNAYNGQGVAVAVCDTGIDYTHARLGNGGFPNAKVIGGYDFGGSSSNPASEDGDPMDGNGHGTNCAGIVAGDMGSSGDYIGGVAHAAKLYAVKIAYGTSGSAWTSDMIAGWEWCIDHQYDDPNNPILVISTSFGGGRFFSACDDDTPDMTDAAANAVSAGMTLFVSSGNDGFCDSIAWPACISHVISVGAVFDAAHSGVGYCVHGDSCAPNQGTHAYCDPDPVAWAYSPQADQVTPYSNVSDILDIFAPSHFTTTTNVGGGYATGFGGTSAACPYAAGVAACIQSAAGQAAGTFLSPAEIRVKLTGAGDLVTYAAAGITRPRVNAGAVDVDDDGMPSEWEVANFGNIARDGTGDADNDALDDYGEYGYGTDPMDGDTDDDQMPDGWEVASGLDPLIDDADQDADEDGFTNLEEYLAETDPGNPSDYPGAVPGANLFLLVIAFLVVGLLFMRYPKKTAS